MVELGDRVDVMEITGVCLTLSGPMDCNLLGSCPWNCLGKNTRAGCCFLLQGIFPTQESKLLPLAPPALAEFFTTSATWEVGNATRFQDISKSRHSKAFETFFFFFFFGLHSLWFSASFFLAKGLHSRIYHSQRILSLQIIKGGTYSFQFTGKRLPALAGAMCPFLE